MKLQFYFSILFLSSVPLLFSQITQIDITHYQIDLNVSDDSDTIWVTERIQFKHNNTKKNIVFNLASIDKTGKGMQILSLDLNGRNVGYRHEYDSLYLDLKTPIKTALNLRVSFKGIPKDGLVIGLNKFGKRTFFGDNWPTRAQNWFACNDHLSDKATVEFIVTAPKKYDVVANGKLVSVEKNKNTKTHHYSSAVPLPTKVMVVGIAEMCMEEADVINGTTVRSYVYPQNKRKAFYDLALAPSILEFYIDYIGPYEFEKLDNVQSTTRFGGMENAGCIFYDEKALKGSRSSENLIAHEIVHQWFGNSATEKDWCHLWLSEGFATYLTNVYIQKTKGEEAFKEQLKQDRSIIISFEKRYAHAVVDTTYSSLMNLLNPNSYQKGGWVLHMLRNEIGDKNFHQAIRDYYKKYRLSNADTRDFQHIVEEIAGKDLRWFFDQWLYTEGHPKLNIELEIQENAIALSVNQTDGLFEFTLPIKINFEDGTSTMDYLNIKDYQTRYKKIFKKAIKGVEIDPEVQLLFEEVK